MVISKSTKTIIFIAVSIIIFSSAFYLFTRAPFKGPATPEEFFKLIDELANSGKLDSPGYVGRKLNVTFNKQHANSFSKSCDEETGSQQNAQEHAYKARSSDTFTPNKDFWFAPAFGEREDLTTQKLMVNRIKPPILDYSISNTLHCDGPHKDNPAKQVTLKFNDIPAYLLIDEDLFKHLRPAIHPEPANDTGDEFFSQPAKQFENRGTIISYRLERETDGNYYIKSIQLEQDEAFGSKAKRDNQPQ